MEGIDFTKTSRSYGVLTIRHFADQEKADPAWLEERRTRAADIASFKREFLVDWTASSGSAFYPAFAEKYIENPEYYVKPLTVIPTLPIVRGWDFGRRLPAVVWMQVAGDYRVRILREIMPENIDIHSFRDLIMFLSGQISGSDSSLLLRSRALSYISKLSALGPVPWFKKNSAFLDYAGQEATRVTSMTGEHGESNDREVLQDRGIALLALPQRVSAGEHILRRLMLPMPDGRGPGLTIDPLCPIIIKGFAGGVTFAKATKKNPTEDRPAKDGWFEHLHDAARYGVTGVVPITEGWAEQEEARAADKKKLEQSGRDRPGVYRRQYEYAGDDRGEWGYRYAGVEYSPRG
jgi:hypothetical protein